MKHKYLPDFFSHFPINIFDDEGDWNFPIKTSSNISLSEDKNYLYVEAT